MKPSTRSAVTIIEILVVVAIIGTLLALLFPAVLSARRRALDVECMNNLRQIGLALNEFNLTYKRYPKSGSKELVGGWTIDLLPFLEQKNLWDQTTPGTSTLTAPDFLLRQPAIFTCPVRSGSNDVSEGMMDQSSYVYVPIGNVFDAPLEVKYPWASGLEMNEEDVIRQTGPHQRGFFYYAGGPQSVVLFMLDGETQW